ncbi:hypothetical protein [Corynebacterium sp. H113]|uniref:hypothetical protein n=1 Tax=Corynebacterium sp. H113 TaxID=3133419 RepID=UPI00309B952B
MTLTRHQAKALQNIRSGYGPLVAGVHMGLLESRRLVHWDGTGWRITTTGMQVLNQWELEHRD